MPALIIIAWLVRDIRAVDGPGPVWDYWSGFTTLRGVAQPTTTATSFVLLLAYAAAAVAALRSAAAASVLIVTGVVTIVLRLPGVWTIADAAAPQDLRDRALLTTCTALAAGLALIVVGTAGRRPSREDAERPVGPGRGTGVAVFLLLGLQAVIFIAWEIRQTFLYPSGLYPAWFIGGRPLNIPVTEGPPGWITGAIILMALVAAIGAVVGAGYARPLGLIAGGFVFSSGVLGMARIIRFEMYERFTDLDIEAQLNLLSFVSSFLVGPVVLILLARKGVQRTPHGPPRPVGRRRTVGRPAARLPAPAGGARSAAARPRLRAPARPLLPAAPLVSG